MLLQHFLNGFPIDFLSFWFLKFVFYTVVTNIYLQHNCKLCLFSSWNSARNPSGNKDKRHLPRWPLLSAEMDLPHYGFQFSWSPSQLVLYHIVPGLECLSSFPLLILSISIYSLGFFIEFTFPKKCSLKHKSSQSAPCMIIELPTYSSKVYHWC